MVHVSFEHYWFSSILTGPSLFVWHYLNIEFHHLIVKCRWYYSHSSLAALPSSIRQLASAFAIKDLGPLHCFWALWFLGLMALCFFRKQSIFLTYWESTKWMVLTHILLRWFMEVNWVYSMDTMFQIHLKITVRLVLSNISLGQDPILLLLFIRFVNLSTLQLLKIE